MERTMEFLMAYIKLEWENRNRLESEVKLEREKRQQLEAEVETLKTLLEPLQKKELEFYRQKHHTAIQNIRKDYYRNGLYGGGRIECDDGAYENGTDIIDLPISDRVCNDTVATHLICPKCQIKYQADGHEQFLIHLEECVTT